MPRKKVNGNIIGARWQDIRLCGEIIAVNRRTGGLEVNWLDGQCRRKVNRRTGGLEVLSLNLSLKRMVNRRTGGLEKRTKFVR